MNNYINYRTKMKNNEDINEDNSQNKNICYLIKNENNNDEDKNRGVYPAYKNLLKQLFNEFQMILNFSLL